MHLLLITLQCCSRAVYTRRTGARHPAAGSPRVHRLERRPTIAQAHSTLRFHVQNAIASKGKGILAMDESNGTCGKRLDAIGVENTEDNRRSYRELLVTTPGLGEYISGAILFEETLYQKCSTGKTMVEELAAQGIKSGIKVRELMTLQYMVCNGLMCAACGMVLGCDMAVTSES